MHVQKDRNGVIMDNHMNQYDNGGRNNGNYNNGGQNNGNRGNGGNGQPPRKPGIVMLIMAGLSTVLIFFLFWNMLFGDRKSVV